jgi:oleate hydratase
MYYSSGNYEAFARPRKPEGVENKTAWFVGSGLASLAGAAFLIRDGQMAGEKITILEELKLPGGALDGLNVPEKGFVIRGGRELEDHMECEWDLFRSIPSLEIEGASVLDDSAGSTSPTPITRSSASPNARGRTCLTRPC